MPLRQRVAVELVSLGVLSSGFLALFPRRPIFVDLGLAVFAVSLVLFNASSTRTHIWAQWPVEGEQPGWWRCVAVTTALTAPALLLFLVVGIGIGYQGAGWPGAKARILHPYIPTAILLYLPWALLQQILFQFYLLGRVRTLFPSLHPLALSGLNGLFFGLVHTADFWIVFLAALGGILWSFLYLRYRLLWPLAVSHALVGTTYYYWVYGHDLASVWRAFLGSL
jgi:membrane protease YdiL (CAAX protease family)